MLSRSAKQDAQSRVNQYPDPPMVKGLPLIGSTFAFWRNPLEFLRRTHERYGDVYAFKVWGRKIVVMGGVEANRFIAEGGKDFFSSFHIWRDTLMEMDCPYSVIGVDGPPHQLERMLMRPMFARSAFAHKIPELSQIFQNALAARNKDKISVTPFMRHLLAKQIGGSLQDYQPSADEVEAVIHHTSTVTNVCLLRKWPRLVLTFPRYRRAKAKVHDLAEKIIGMRQPDGAPPRYLDVLIEEGKKRAPQWFTSGDIRHHAIIPFLAGIEALSAAMSFMLLELFRRPDIRKILQKEVDDTFDQEEPDIGAIERMRNVDNFVREVLRLYPPVYAMNRTATTDFIFKGRRIHCGQIISLFFTSNHTNPVYFKEPYRFDLTRYVEPRFEHRISGTYGVFGKGPHACLGAGLAKLLLPLNLALILRHTEISPACNLKKIRLDFSSPGVTLNKKFLISLVPRRHVVKS